MRESMEFWRFGIIDDGKEAKSMQSDCTPLLSVSKSLKVIAIISFEIGRVHWFWLRNFVARCIGSKERSCRMLLRRIWYRSWFLLPFDRNIITACLLQGLKTVSNVRPAAQPALYRPILKLPYCRHWCNISLTWECSKSVVGLLGTVLSAPSRTS